MSPLALPTSSLPPPRSLTRLPLLPRGALTGRGEAQFKVGLCAARAAQLAGIASRLRGERGDEHFRRWRLVAHDARGRSALQWRRQLSTTILASASE